MGLPTESFYEDYVKCEFPENFSDLKIIFCYVTSSTVETRRKVSENIEKDFRL